MTNVVDKVSETGKKGVELTAKALVQTASGSKAVAKGAKDFPIRQRLMVIIKE